MTVDNSHYKAVGIDALNLACQTDFVVGNIIKYLARFQFKNGVGDLKKAFYYTEIFMKDKKHQASKNKLSVYQMEEFANQFDGLAYALLNQFFIIDTNNNKDIEAILKQYQNYIETNSLSKKEVSFLTFLQFAIKNYQILMPNTPPEKTEPKQEAPILKVVPEKKPETGNQVNDNQESAEVAKMETDEQNVVNNQQEILKDLKNECLSVLTDHHNLDDDVAETIFNKIFNFNNTHGVKYRKQEIEKFLKFDYDIQASIIRGAELKKATSKKPNSDGLDELRLNY